MKKLNKSGARLLCAITLALLCFTAPANAGLTGDEATNPFSGDYSYSPFTNAEITRVGTLYTFHKNVDTDENGDPFTNDNIIHLEFYTANPIAVGEIVFLTTIDRSGNNNTVRMYDVSAANGSYAQRVPHNGGSTSTWFITQMKESFGVPGGLIVYHKADNEWIVNCSQMYNSNNKVVTPSYGERPEYTLNFVVADAPWNNGTLSRSSATAALGNNINCTPTASSGYKFGIWSNGEYYTGQTMFKVLGNATYTAYFVPESAESRTVTATADPADGTAGLWYRAARGIAIPVVVTSASVFEGVPVTLVATQTGSNPFHHWEDEGGNTLDPSVILSSNTANGVTTTQVIVPTGKNTTYTAVFAPAAPATPTYTVAATVSPVGAGTVTGADTYDENDNVTLTATPTNRRYRFVRWTESASEVGTETSYTINDIAANHTLVAEFEEIPVTLADNEESSYYTSTLSTFTGSMNFQLMRTFYAGMWNTVCFPFALSSSQIAASDMSGATFYTLTSVTGDAAEGLDFNVSEVTSLSARTPYLVQVSGANIVNPVFEGVTLDGSAFTNNTTGQSVGETKFFGTVHPTDLAIGENSGFLFLGQNNTLYWPSVANKIRAFRAYFYSGNNAVQAIHPRVRIVLQNETTTDIEEIGVPGESGVSGKSGLSGASVKKYLRNGSLVIERDGIRYNAVGEQIK